MQCAALEQFPRAARSEQAALRALAQTHLAVALRHAAALLAQPPATVVERDALPACVDLVVVLGATVVDRLFGASANPIGQSVRIGKSPFKIGRAHV